MESLRAVAALVDGYLRRRVAKGMTVNSFYRLVAVTESSLSLSPSISGYLDPIIDEIADGYSDRHFNAIVLVFGVFAKPIGLLDLSGKSFCPTQREDEAHPTVDHLNGSSNILPIDGPRLWPCLKLALRTLTQRRPCAAACFAFPQPGFKTLQKVLTAPTLTLPFHANPSFSTNLSYRPRRLAMALPPESRASHDELFHAMMEFLRAGNKQLTDMERLGLCETVNPAKLSDAAAEQALRSDDVPIAYVAQILMAQKVRQPARELWGLMNYLWRRFRTWIACEEVLNA